MIRYKKLQSDAIEPKYATPGSAGLDVCNTGIVKVGKKVVFYGTGLAFDIPKKEVGLLFLRSSMAPNGHALANAVGVIDSDFRGELIIMLDRAKHDEAIQVIKQYDRIAQLVVMPFCQHVLKEVDNLARTKRGKGGIGSTGVS